MTMEVTTEAWADRINGRIGPFASVYLPGLDADPVLRRALARLTSCHDGDVGVVDTVACGERAILPLRAILFSRDPSGYYEGRRRAVDALSQLHARDVLMDYLATPTAAHDPVESAGDEAVLNAVARALGQTHDPKVVPILLDRAAERPMAGVADALGELHCIEALDSLMRGLGDDMARPASEAAIRKLGQAARKDLLKTATSPLPNTRDESESSRRRRRGALALYAELGPVAAEEWPAVRGLMTDPDPDISVTASAACLANPNKATRRSAVLRLLHLLRGGNWIMADAIQAHLTAHFGAGARAGHKLGALHGDW